MATRRVAKKVEQPNTENKPTIVDNDKNKYAPKKDALFDLFCEFMALPEVIRPQVFTHPSSEEPLENQEDFRKAYKVNKSTLSRWKNTEEYQAKVSKIRRQYFRGQIGDAIQAVLVNVMTNGRGADLKVLLEYTKEIERDDPTGEISDVLTTILAKVGKLIPD